MSLTYGYDLREGDGMKAALVQANKTFIPLLLPGAALVNHVPLCAVPLVTITILVPHHYF